MSKVTILKTLAACAVLGLAACGGGGDGIAGDGNCYITDQQRPVDECEKLSMTIDAPKCDGGACK